MKSSVYYTQAWAAMGTVLLLAVASHSVCRADLCSEPEWDCTAVTTGVSQRVSKITDPGTNCGTTGDCPGLSSCYWPEGATDAGQIAWLRPCISYNQASGFIAKAFAQGKVTIIARWVGTGQRPTDIYLKLYSTTETILSVGGVAYIGKTGPSGIALKNRRVVPDSPYDPAADKPQGVRWKHVKVVDGVIPEVSATGGGLASISYPTYSTSDMSLTEDTIWAHVYVGFDKYACFQGECSPPAYASAAAKSHAPHDRSAPIHPNCRDPFDPKKLAGETGSDPVNVATGEHLLFGSPDLAVYNPAGPAAFYIRSYYGSRAAAGYSSPGLTQGWTDNYDAVITAVAPGTNHNLKLTWPNGAEETLDATGAVTTTADSTAVMFDHGLMKGRSYIVTGSKNTTTGKWNWVSIMWGDHTKWLFKPAGTGSAADTYLLVQSTNAVGNSISIVRGAGSPYRVEEVRQGALPGDSSKVLLQMAYNADGTLASVTDKSVSADERKIVYGYTTAGGATCLSTVSQISPAGVSSPPARFTYGYETITGHPHLNAISSPSPTGTGASTTTISFVSGTSKVSQITDANGNKTIYDYEYNNGTRIKTARANDHVDEEFIYNFDPANGNRSLGITDAYGFSTFLAYGDADNPTKVTKAVDKEGRATSFTYDDFGNLESTTTPRKVVTTNTYTFGAATVPSGFPLGRLESTQKVADPSGPSPVTRKQTEFEYYTATGLVKKIKTPRPGQSGTNATLVETVFEYDGTNSDGIGGLGNLLKKISPAAAASGTVETVWSYGTSPRLGQPLSVKRVLGTGGAARDIMTNFDYDARGRLKTVADPLGNETGLTYNIAGQVQTVIHPQD